MRADQTLQTEVWAILESMRGMSPADVTGMRLIALLALRQVLDARHVGAVVGSAAAFPEPASFGALPNALDPQEAVERVLHLLTRGSEGMASLAEALRTALDLSNSTDRRALAFAVQAVARIASTLLVPAALVSAAQQVLLRTSGRGGEYLVAAPRVLLVMAELANIRNNARIHDPSCGAGFVLLAAAQSLATRGLQAEAVGGTELNPRVAALAKVLLSMAGVSGDIATANVLMSTSTNQGSYDAVLSIPPFNTRPPPHLHIEASGRFRFGTPTRHADWLYVQHAVSLLAPGGSATLLLSRGPLFRSGVEADVRRGLVEANLVEAVVGLPSNLLEGTSLPPTILVLRRERDPARKQCVMFVDVSDGARTAERRPDLREDVVEKLLTAVRDGASADPRIHVRAVCHEEIAANGYELVPARYCASPSSELQNDLLKVGRELADAETNERVAKAALRQALLGLLAETSASD